MPGMPRPWLQCFRSCFIILAIMLMKLEHQLYGASPSVLRRFSSAPDADAGFNLHRARGMALRAYVTWLILNRYRKLLRCIKMTSLLRQALKLSVQERANLEVARAPFPANFQLTSHV